MVYDLRGNIARKQAAILAHPNLERVLQSFSPAGQEVIRGLLTKGVTFKLIRQAALVPGSDREITDVFGVIGGGNPFMKMLVADLALDFFEYTVNEEFFDPDHEDHDG